MSAVEFDAERGRAIAARRRAIGFSQRAAARVAELSNTAWARFERGEPMAPSSQARVEEVLGMPLAQLPAALDEPIPEVVRPVEDGLRWRVERLERAVRILATQMRDTLEGDEARAELDEFMGGADSDPPAGSDVR